MTRGKRNTEQITVRINVNVMEELKLINPSLITRDIVNHKIKFRHGALGKYIERLIANDVEKRQNRLTNESEQSLEQQANELFTKFGLN